MTPVSDTLAVIADIHGNIWALDAVLADIDGRGITRSSIWAIACTGRSILPRPPTD